MKQKLTVTTLAAALAFSGCAGKSVRSNVLEDEEKPQSGIVYALPRGLLKVTVKLTEKQELTFNAEPLVVPDIRRRYRAQFLPSAFAEDTFSVSVDANGLLSSSTMVILPVNKGL